MEQNKLIGKVIKEIYLAEDGGAIRFILDDGNEVKALADGDCCSHSWIESLDTPSMLIGSEVVSVEDIDMPDLGDLPDHDVMSYYGLKITSKKGSCVIDYRNDSNGYYGGSIAWDEYNHYGGVHGQNKSLEHWKLIVS